MANIIIGRFGKTHGVRGWIRVHSYTQPPDNLLEYDNWLIGDHSNWQSIAIEAVRKHGDHYLAKITEIDSPEQVQPLTNQYIAIDGQQLPKLTDDEFYWHQLIGLTVINTQQIHLGKVTDLLETGANDVLVVKQDDQQRLIPYSKQVVQSVDLQHGQIIVDWDEDF